MAITLTSFAENWTSEFKNINSVHKVVREAPSVKNPSKLTVARLVCENVE